MENTLTRKETLLAKIESVLKLPLTEYHKLQLILRDTLKALEVDRCWLQYPCLPNAESYFLPIEESVSAYPGANRLKAYEQAKPVCSHISEKVLSTKEAVNFKLGTGLSQQLTDIYQKFTIKSQMACQIPVKNSETWVIGVHHCTKTHSFSDEEKALLTSVSRKISSTLNELFSISNLINGVELSTDTLTNSPLAYVIYSLDHRLIYANPSYCELNQYSLEELFNIHAQQNMAKGKKSEAIFNNFFDSIMRTGRAFTRGTKITGKGNKIYVENTGNLINYNGQPHYIISSKNVTEETITLESLNSALDIQSAILEATEDGILVEDISRNVIAINQNFFDYLSITNPHEKNIKTLELLPKGIINIINAEEVTASVVNLLPTSKERQLITMKLVDKTLLEMESFPLIHQDIIKGRVWYFRDITEKHYLAHKLSHQATHDVLTKLTNRRGFDEKLKANIEEIQSEDTVHALLYLDLDHFKIINDSSGHAAGDMALIEISKVLSQLLRKSDTLARVGGDEFCILLNNCSPKKAKSIADKVHKAIDEYIFNWQHKTYNLGVSIGIVTLDKTIDSYETALNLADTSCYLAKEEGRNRIHTHTTSDQAVLHRLQQGNIVNQIQEALRTDHFSCYVQRICTTDVAGCGNSCINPKYEILIRMLDEEGEIISPDVFLPPAERYNLMYKIDHWVINNSIQHMADIQKHFDWFSINLSGQTIAHENTYNIIVNALQKSSLPAEKLCFEITETAAISNPQAGIAFLHKLQALGCKVALDDFGTGLSSYEYLKTLPADILKIDGQFIKNMLDDPLDLAMVKSINEIGHLMGKETIGEFVENEEIFTKLKAIGVDYGQGYYLHKPCSLEALIKELKQRN